MVVVLPVPTVNGACGDRLRAFGAAWAAIAELRDSAARAAATATATGLEAEYLDARKAGRKGDIEVGSFVWLKRPPLGSAPPCILNQGRAGVIDNPPTSSPGWLVLDVCAWSVSSSE
ncbi:hypothetical protein GPN2_20094 [Streptomyces murinus]